MKRTAERALAKAALLLMTAAQTAFAQAIAYVLHVDPAHATAEVSIALRDVPTDFHLAMRIHAEYDAKYWRYLDLLRIEDASAAPTSIQREDSTLWRVHLSSGRGVVRYTIHVQPPDPRSRSAWRPYLSAEGALINPPDFLLYVPELAGIASTLELRGVPANWQIATALPIDGAATRRRADDAVALLDSPILLGRVREWTVADRGTTFHVAYLPIPQPTYFDTVAFVDGLRRIAGATLDVFGTAPVRDYWILVQDGASDALEHRASSTIGVPSAELARNPHTRITEITHEFFHTWNLVTIRPSGYNDLSHRPPTRTPSLWIGEGITMHYADVLPRRAGLSDSMPSRLTHLRALLERYYDAALLHRVSPEDASLAFGDTPIDNPRATGGYYVQGELLGEALDGLMRDSTHGEKGLDAIMRAMYDASRRQPRAGYPPERFEHVADSVCGCNLGAFFERQVRGTGPIDVSPTLARVGLNIAVDTVPAVDDRGNAMVDARLPVSFSIPGSPRVVISNSTTAWARAGLRSGDRLVAIAGRTVGSFADLQAVLRELRLPDVGRSATVPVDVVRDGRAMHLDVPLKGYDRTRVVLTDAPMIAPNERNQRQRWLAGY